MPPILKPAKTDHPILDVIANRWSPLAFSEKPIEDEKVAQLFEAARWAASSYNEQPWIYVYAAKGDEGRETLEALLVEGNAWAKHAGLLVVAFARKNFSKNGKPNVEAQHDVGAATAFLTLQAEALALVTHQMAGFYSDRANAALSVPLDYEPSSMIAVGYPGDSATLPEDLRKREESPRVRRKIEEFAFRGKFGKS